MSPRDHLSIDRCQKRIDRCQKRIAVMEKKLNENEVKHDKIFLHNKTKHVSIFFTRLWSVRKPMLFYSKGSLVTNQQNVIFLLSRFILLAVWFCVYTHAQLRILKFQDSMYQKAEVCAQTINE